MCYTPDSCCMGEDLATPLLLSSLSLLHVGHSFCIVFNSPSGSWLGQSPRPATICASTQVTVVSHLNSGLFCLSACVSWLKVLLKPKYCLLRGRNNCVRKTYFQITSRKWIFFSSIINDHPRDTRDFFRQKPACMRHNVNVVDVKKLLSPSKRATS